MGKSGKGQRWERALARMFSLWLTNGERDDCVWRSQTSGARATTRAAKGLRTAGQYGDLTWTEPSVQAFFSRVVVEAKKGYTDLDLLALLDGKQGAGNHKLQQFILQAEEAAGNAGSQFFMLALYRDRHHPVAVLPLNFWSWCSQLHGSPPNSSLHLTERVRGQCPRRYAMLRLEDWLEWMSPEDFGVRYQENEHAHEHHSSHL